VSVAWGAVHKRRPQSGGRGFVQCRHFADKGKGGFFRCERPHFLVQKILEFFEIYGCALTDQGERVEPVRTGGWGWWCQFFAILCGRLLWTALNSFSRLTLSKLTYQSDYKLFRIKPMSLYDEHKLLKKLLSLKSTENSVQARCLRRKLQLRQVWNDFICWFVRVKEKLPTNTYWSLPEIYFSKCFTRMKQVRLIVFRKHQKTHNAKYTKRWSKSKSRS